MKKRLLTLILAAAMLVSVLTPVSAFAGDTISVGTWDALVDAVLEDDGYSGKTIRLTADITAAPGDSWPGFNDFAGTFDGAGHTIYGIRMNGTSETDPMGFFSSTVSGAVIRDLVLSDSSFRNKCMVAPLIGKSSGSLTVQSVRISNDTAVSASYQFGGLIGRVEGDAAITNCWSAAAVTSASVGGRAAAGSAGGLIGWVHAGSETVITGCSYSGTLATTSTNNYGGIVGTVYATENAPTRVRIASCATAFSFDGSGGRRGGLVGGSMGGASYTTIELVNDYTNSEVVVGDNVSGAISDIDLNYWTPNKTGGTVNTATKSIAFQAQLMGYALASKNYNFRYRALSLNNDIDMTGWGEWPMLGSSNRYFLGNFNGNGHTISGLHVNTVSETLSPAIPTGFIAVLYLGAAVNDLTISNSSFLNGTPFTGAIAGRVMDGATINGSHVTGDVSVSGYDQVGGICGSLMGSVNQCWSEANVSITGESAGYRAAGGVAATVLTTGSSISDCLFTGSVYAGMGVVGGILGATRNDSCYVTITGCLSAGTLNGNAAGGILGDFSSIYRETWSESTYPQTYAISDCYAAPAAKAVGTLSSGFADSFVSNTSVYADISSLHGNVCSRLSGSVWTKRTGNIPMLTVFNDSELPVVSGKSFTETDWASYRSIREALSDVPLPANSTVDYEGRMRLGSYYRKVTVEVSDNPLPTYAGQLQSAGFAMVGGSTTSLYTWHKDIYAAIFTKGDRTLLVKYQNASAGKQIWVGVYPSSLDENPDADTLFSGVPGVSGQSPAAVDYGAGNMVKTYTGVSKTNYNTICSSLISGGFIKVAENGSGLYGTVFTSSYQKDSRTVTVIFLSRRSEIYVSAGEDEPISPHLNDQAIWAADASVFDKTVLVMPKILGDANSFIVRLKNGHFLLNDGGNLNDAPHLVETLERMTPAGQIPVVEGWFISHNHADHCGALYNMVNDPAIRSRVRVDGVYMSETSKAVNALEPDAVGMVKAVVKYTSLLRTSSGEATPIYRNHTGERYYFSDMSVDILFAQEQLPLNEYSGNFNDSSTWIVLNIDGDKVLIGGDGDAGEVRRLVGFDSLGLSIEKTYTKSELTFTMRSALHHGYNESNTFTNATESDVLLITSPDPDNDVKKDSFTGGAFSRAKSFVDELIRCDEDRWISFPYSVGTAETPEDISEYRSGSGLTAPEAPEGKVFGGWYWDSAFTIPVEKESTGGEAFARFVDADVLKVRYAQDGTEYPQATKKLWIATTVDTLGYQKAGFTVSFVNSSGVSVTRELSTTTVFESLNWFVDGSDIPYAPTEFSSESAYFVSYKLAANRFVVANNPEGITVTPFWITKDGTRVTGTALTELTFGTGSGLQEITGDGDEIMLD